ncbi:hypothetical protein ACBI99_08095 [Nonomuraea sp. ATR24]|uniref:hypothetical protein n=1 Tax=Nonomuraea sp. ATR24 TaxID=1676744 RepID=UPI0035C00B06
MLETLTFVLLIGLLLLALAWPVAVLAVLALAALSWWRHGRRPAWAPPAVAAATALAAYGYGLSTTTFGAWTDPDDRCGLARPDLYAYGHRGPESGALSMWPLGDTTCGPDLVPGFVNPLIAVSVTVAVAATVALVARRRRAELAGERG